QRRVGKLGFGRATMRLPEAKIKEALVHPERLVRQEALRYFAGCHSRDAEVMPLKRHSYGPAPPSRAFVPIALVSPAISSSSGRPARTPVRGRCPGIGGRGGPPQSGWCRRR